MKPFLSAMNLRSKAAELLTSSAKWRIGLNSLKPWSLVMTTNDSTLLQEVVCDLIVPEQ